jgi:hypothetical protein
MTEPALLVKKALLQNCLSPRSVAPLTTGIPP